MDKVHAKRFDRLLAVLRQEDETLLKLDVGFNMGPLLGRVYPWTIDKSGHTCGTVACIAGTAALLSVRSNEERHKILSDKRGRYDMWAMAREWLGLSRDQADDLFTGAGANRDLNDISLRSAIGAVQRFVDTGKIRFR